MISSDDVGGVMVRSFHLYINVHTYSHSRKRERMKRNFHRYYALNQIKEEAKVDDEDDNEERR